MLKLTILKLLDLKIGERFALGSDNLYFLDSDLKLRIAHNDLKSCSYSLVDLINNPEMIKKEFKPTVGRTYYCVDFMNYCKYAEFKCLNSAQLGDIINMYKHKVLFETKEEAIKRHDELYNIKEE